MTFSLTLLESILQAQVAPQAEAIDQDPVALARAFQLLGEQSCLALRVPTSWGGAGQSDAVFQEYQETLARYSGALAFLQAQHQSAAVFLTRSSNQRLKQTYLPRMGTGDVGIGVGFSHLRRRVPPLKATPGDGGYVLDGVVPWVTGYGLFQWFVVAAVLPDHSVVYGLVPFTETLQPTGGVLTVSAPMRLACMASTQTVTAELRAWKLAEAEVLWLTSGEAIHQNDRLNVLQHSFFALGCARAGLDVVERALEARSRPVLDAVYGALSQELKDCRTAIFAADSSPFEERLRYRAWAIDLAVRCAHAGVTVSAGAANQPHHPAQRIYREALVFTVSGQTAAVMEATLQRLLRNREGTVSGAL